jgi:hypothetical protein
VPAAAQPANPYASPAPASAYGTAPAESRVNTLAIIALILAFLIPLGGIICGHIALAQIKRTGERGHGLALAGTILGYVFTALWIIGAIIWAAVWAAFIGSGGLDYNNFNY